MYIFKVMRPPSMKSLALKEENTVSSFPRDVPAAQL